jgi:putative PIN family toxin of toxin-antitoxin system
MTKQTPIKVVVDTNLFVSGSILKRGNPYELLEAWRHKAFVLLISDALETEIAEVLVRPEIKEKYHLTDEEVADTLRLLKTDALLTSPAPTLPVVLRDPKDEKVLAVALGGQADYLVTGDEDLLSVAGKNPDLVGLRIITPATFVALLKGKLNERGGKKAA